MLRYIRRDTRQPDAAAFSALRPYTGVLAALLYARGIDTAAQADAFLDPRLDDLHDPLLLDGVSDALTLLAQAKEEHWPTVVYGDYDADGVCAAALMTEALRAYGLTVTPHVPLRAEGYGLNLAAVETLATEYKLMVTVDLGITNAAEVKHAQALGMRMIVTDHHQPGLVPCPADVVIDPVLGGYPFPRLCGAGVALKLATALLGAQTALQWLDLAALATVADIVPLLDENRIIVSHGLPLFTKRPGLAALMQAAGCTQPLTAETVAFQLAPRLNAAGRIADANLGIRLLLTHNPAEAETLAKTLDRANTERKQLEAEATTQAEAQAETHDFITSRMLFVRGEDWNSGIIGLVAGKLNRRYGVPVCAMSESDGCLHGSLRGVEGVNLARCLQACDDLLVRYGGHEMAAGVTLETEKDEAFRARLEAAVAAAAPEDAFLPMQPYDAPLSFADVDDDLISLLAKLQPFGTGNPAPVFYTPGAQLIRRRACGAQGAHLQLALRDGARSLDGIAFGMGAQANRLPDAVDAAYTLAKETYMGRESIKCQVQALTPAVGSRTHLLQQMPQATFDDALLRLLRDGLTAFPPDMAGKDALDAELIKAVPRGETGVFTPAGSETDSGLPTALYTPNGDAADTSALLTGRQGTLLIAYTRETAQRVLDAAGDRVDVAVQSPDDPRCFHTLLVQPEPQAIRGCWKNAVLLDGPLTPQDVLLWQRSLPDTALYLAAPSPALRTAAASIDAGDAQYRALYKLLSRSTFNSLYQTAQAAALTQAQTLAGLSAFHTLGLIAFSQVPFHYTFLKPHPCSLSESLTLGALRALTAPMEAGKC